MDPSKTEQASKTKAELMAAIEDVIADAPAPNFYETDYNAGFIAGLIHAKSLMGETDA